MTSLAFARAESRLSVVAFPAVPVLINRIHLHARAAFFVFEYRGMTIIAVEHRGVERVAEDCRGHIAGGIFEIFFHSGHVMAFCAVLRGEGHGAVMTLSAIFTFVKVFHRHRGRSPLHLKSSRVALIAAEHIGMALMREIYGHG